MCVFLLVPWPINWALCCLIFSHCWRFWIIRIPSSPQLLTPWLGLCNDKSGCGLLCLCVCFQLLMKLPRIGLTTSSVFSDISWLSRYLMTVSKKLISFCGFHLVFSVCWVIWRHFGRRCPFPFFIFVPSLLHILAATLMLCRLAYHFTTRVNSLANLTVLGRWNFKGWPVTISFGQDHMRIRMRTLWSATFCSQLERL